VGGLDADAGSKQMSESSVITDRDTIRSSPPGILMTNYKMLDYLLIRKDDRSLWENNGAETLKYLVVDELHSFDGAQGSDLACLIRRVKKRLKTPAKHLCCVGTSATLGGEAGIASMLDFAGKIFGEPFSTDGVILETRKGYKDHIDPEENLEIRYLDPPGPEHSSKLGPADYADIEDYIAGQIHLWFGNGATLDYDTVVLARAGEQFTGAEIEAIFIDALHEAYADDREPDAKDILTAMTSTVPLAQLMDGQISALRHWSKGRARAATNAPTTPGNGNTRHISTMN
jgi:hypothetical protein